MKSFEKLLIVFGVIVFITFMNNHGFIDWSGIDLVRDKTSEVINSEQGQEYISETKEISKNAFHDMFYGFKHFLFGEKESKPEQAALIRCVDSDTLIVNIDGNDTTVRLIGIDAPESVNPDKEKKNKYGDMASAYTKMLLKDTTTLFLEYDKQKTDQYGRTLAYVWLSDDRENAENKMLNAILVKNGYATDALYMPNDKYADMFYMLKNDAKDSSSGLWQYEEYTKLVAAKEAHNE